MVLVPRTMILEGSHKVELAAGFGRKIRNLLATPEYRAVFPTSRSRTTAGPRTAGRPDRAASFSRSAPAAARPAAAATW